VELAPPLHFERSCSQIIPGFVVVETIGYGSAQFFDYRWEFYDPSYTLDEGVAYEQGAFIPLEPLLTQDYRNEYGCCR
jgi:hypothetical protein